PSPVGHLAQTLPNLSCADASARGRQVPATAASRANRQHEETSNAAALRIEVWRAILGDKKSRTLYGFYFATQQATSSRLSSCSTGD
ncbi:MAG: hypothetical protein ACKO1K_10555, partial [Burkholderiales bacterium]